MRFLRRAGLFVGGAVLAGVVAGVIVPVLAISGDGRDRSGRRTAVADAPTMPPLVGEPLDEADRKLDELGIPHDTEGGGLFGVIVDSNWEVCDTQPEVGEAVRDVALLAVDRPGEC